jgi:hypothetical protein
MTSKEGCLGSPRIAWRALAFPLAYASSQTIIGCLLARADASGGASRRPLKDKKRRDGRRTCAFSGATAGQRTEPHHQDLRECPHQKEIGDVSHLPADRSVCGNRERA